MRRKISQSPAGEERDGCYVIVEDSLCLVEVVGPSVVDIVAKCGGHHSEGI